MALVMHRAKCMRRITLSSVAGRAVQVFHTIS